MTALILEAPTKPVAIPGSLIAPSRVVEPVTIRAQEPVMPEKVCLTKPRPVLIAPASRIRALNTANMVAGREDHTAAIRAPARAVAAAASAVLKSPAANLAFFMSRRPSMLGDKLRGKFRA